MSEVEKVKVKVVLQSGAYTTNKVRGMQASSTISAEMAVNRLGDKLFDADLIKVEKVDPVSSDSPHWLIHAKRTALIQIGPTDI